MGVERFKGSLLRLFDELRASKGRQEFRVQCSGRNRERLPTANSVEEGYGTLSSGRLWGRCGVIENSFIYRKEMRYGVFGRSSKDCLA
jgi:hypothetical protein